LRSTPHAGRSVGTERPGTTGSTSRDGIEDECAIVTVAGLVGWAVANA